MELKTVMYFLQNAFRKHVQSPLSLLSYRLSYGKVEKSGDLKWGDFKAAINQSIRVYLAAEYERNRILSKA
jgi:hypothetical protein